MSPIGSRHAACVKRLMSLFGPRLGAKAILSVQDPVRLGRYSEPEPDVALLHPRADFYAKAHPEPEDVLLLVEVAESSLDYDLKEKVPAYARAGIVEVWVVNLADEVVTVHRRPAPAGYESVRTLGRARRLVPQAFPSLQTMVGEILG